MRNEITRLVKYSEQRARQYVNKRLSSKSLDNNKYITIFQIGYIRALNDMSRYLDLIPKNNKGNTNESI